jgi:hypothetical protein
MEKLSYEELLAHAWEQVKRRCKTKQRFSARMHAIDQAVGERLRGFTQAEVFIWTDGYTQRFTHLHRESRRAAKRG